MSTIHKQSKMSNRSPREALIEQGVFLEVLVGLSDRFANEISSQGKNVPLPVPGDAIIDTGAYITCIDEEVVRKLGIEPCAYEEVILTGGNKTRSPIYSATIEFVGCQMRFEASKVAGVDLSENNAVALIGRDALSHFTLFYNGIAGEFTLSSE